MILTKVSDLKRYQNLNPYFTAAFAALEASSKESFVPGRHEVDGDNVFIHALAYDTKAPADSKMEHHVRYVDVMWMVSGEETIGICPASELANITRPYSYDDDVALADLTANYSAVQMRPGMVAIIFPEDAHAPGMQLSGPCHVQKLIAKVRAV